MSDSSTFDLVIPGLTAMARGQSSVRDHRSSQQCDKTANKEPMMSNERVVSVARKSILRESVWKLYLSFS